jgi:hypothetical protein
MKVETAELLTRLLLVLVLVAVMMMIMSILLCVLSVSTIRKKCIAVNNEDALMAQLVEALRYKPEGRGFGTRWCHWNFSST